MNINIDNLNVLENEIHVKIMTEHHAYDKFTISQAAELCGCSTSKISKYVKKLGFSNYKQYMHFLNGTELPAPSYSNEFDRIRQFLDDFDNSMIDDFLSLIDPYDKVVLFGYGPSYYCALYFECKLRLYLRQAVIATSDEYSAQSIIDKNTIVIVLSTTGSFSTFTRLKQTIQEKEAQLLMLVEEYNTSIVPEYGKIFFLTNSFQASTAVPYEKSRVVFFIFIEEIANELMKRKSLEETNT